MPVGSCLVLSWAGGKPVQEPYILINNWQRYTLSLFFRNWYFLRAT
jgi:hypothetical protein